jgi:peroxiredoxin
MAITQVKWKNVFGNAGSYILYMLGVLLVIQNYHLYKNINALKNPKPGVALGVPLRHLAGITPNAQYREISEAELSKMLIITFTPTCHFCIDQQPKWNTVTQKIRQKPDWHVLWISTAGPESTRAYCNKYSIPLSEVISNPVYSTYYQLNLRSVPTTVVVRKGIVAQQWFGTLNENDWSQLNMNLQ